VETSREPVRIEPLADHPEAIPTIARWHFDQWGRKSPTRSVASAAERLRGHLRRDATPLTMVALAGDALVGSAALICQDMKDARPELSPWLADVFVDPARRRRGVASALVAALVAKARALGVENLHLYTPDQERLYARFGFVVRERIDYRGERVALMSLELSRDRPRS
jgi:predicted N-acetyltransferase YhbS